MTRAATSTVTHTVAYIDTSVALARLFAEDQRPPESFWTQALVSSRLLEYEMWTRVYARGLGKSHGEAIRQMLARIDLVELSPVVLTRVLEPFPQPVRTLDAIHLATIQFLREQGQKVLLASYDNRMNLAAEAMDIPLISLSIPASRRRPFPAR